MSREVAPGPPRPAAGPPTHAELIRSFLGISLLGFGGPNAHLALMLDEVVERRGWLDRAHFLQLVAVTNLLPGPNSSEVAIHVGYTQRGWTGALATGLTFLLPTFVMVTGLSWLYFRWGALPAVEPLFWGLKPAVLALILWAGVKLGREVLAPSADAEPAPRPVPRAVLWALALVGAGVAFVDGRWAVAAMLLGGAIGWAIGRRTPSTSGRGATRSQGSPEERPAILPPWLPVPTSVSSLDPALPAGGLLVGATSLLTVFWTHLWIGSVLFGGGYVLVVLLEPQAVDAFGWLTSAQFLDGVALTQAVPGPISTLAAFVGFAAAGFPGAVLGTAGVYLPAFAAVLLVAPHLERLRASVRVKAALDGVGAVVAGAIVGVAATLLPPAVPGPWSAVVLVVALVALVRHRVRAPWIVGGGLAAGLLRVAVAGV